MSYQQFDSLTDLQSSQTHTLLICAELVFDSLTDLQSSQTPALLSAAFCVFDSLTDLQSSQTLMGSFFLTALFDSLTDLQSSQTSNYVLTELCCQLYFIIKHLSLSIIYVFSPSKLLCSRFSINKSCSLQ